MLRYLASVSIACFVWSIGAAPIWANGATPEVSRVSLGAGMYGGYYNFVTVGGGTVDWEGGDGYGIGIVAEYMLSDIFSIQTGFWYGVNYINLSMEGSGTIEARTANWVVPLYIIMTYSWEHASVGLLGGLSFMHIIKSEFRGGMGNVSEIDVSEYLNYDLYGPSGGLQVKIRVARFVDLFMQGLAEIYANKFIETSGGGTAEYLYDFRVVAGVMLRTY